MNTSNYKDVVEYHSAMTNYDPPLYHCQQDSIHLPCNYYCSLIACGKTFSTAHAYSSKDKAEMEAAKLACQELNLLSQKTYSGPSKPQEEFTEDLTYDKFYSNDFAHNDNNFQNKQSIIDNNQRHDKPYKPINKQPQRTNKPNNNQSFSQKQKRTPKHALKIEKTPLELAQYLQTLPTSSSVAANTDVIPVSSIEEVWGYMNGHVLASSFKSLLHLYSQLEQVQTPTFTTVPVEAENLRNLKLFKTMVHFNGQTCESIGPMQHKKQSQMSACEVYLRSNGYLPPANSIDDYTIQPYKGGKIFHLQPKQSVGRCLLHEFCVLNQMPVPIYRAKKKEGDGDGKPAFHGCCIIDDKIFIAEGSNIPKYLRVKAFTAALNYFNIPVDRETFHGEFLTKLLGPKTMFRLRFSKGDSPFMRSPSENMGWINKCIADPVLEIDGNQLAVDALKQKMYINFSVNSRRDCPYAAFLTQPPSFQCVPLKEKKDLTVCYIDSTNPNTVMLGNKDFSITMFCEGQELYSSNRGCNVKLMPGHNISGLECTYIVTPSHDIYLKGMSCFDLYFPNRAKPVIRSCSLVMILHDPEVGDYPHVLFTRPLNAKGFPASSKVLSEYLTRVLTGDMSKKLNVGELVTNMKFWKDDEIRLLGQMTMDSMYELYSSFTKYDNRWNEIFMKPLTKDLLDLKSACNKEAGRRRIKKAKPLTDGEKAWEVPKFNFKSRMYPTGHFIEDSIMCAIRGFRNLTGIRLKLGDFDDVPFVDIPVTDSSFRGANDRYFIWARTVTEEDKENYLTKSSVDLYDENLWYFVKHNGKIVLNHEDNPTAEGKRIPVRKQPPHAKKARLEEGESEAAGSHETQNQIDEDENEEEEHCEGVAPSSHTQYEDIECKWFDLTKAPSINSSFKAIIESPTFAAVMKEMKK